MAGTVQLQNMLKILFILLALQQPKDYPLQRFDVIRVNTDDMSRLPESVRSLFVDPVPDGEAVDNLEEAVKRAGFTPRILKSPAVVQLYVSRPMNEQAMVNVAELTNALRDAKITNVTVPQAWNDVVVNLRQSAGVLTDYGDFFIAQAPPLTLSAAAGFPLDQFMDVLFRIMGLPASDAGALRQKFAANPSQFFPIPKRYAMDIRQVPIGSGTGLLLQNADKGGELALMWSTADRSYFLSGQLTEAQAIAAANSLQ